MNPRAHRPPGSRRGRNLSVSAEQRRRWLEDLLAEQRVSRVKPNMARAGELINQARNHINSATTLAQTDQTLALVACHDAVRKALDAHAGARGFRFENRPGAHRTTLDYGRHLLTEDISPDDLDDAESLRSRRHAAEYDGITSSQVSPAEVAHHAAVAKRIVDAVAKNLARGPHK